jgi:hypothetical protein
MRRIQGIVARAFLVAAVTGMRRLGHKSLTPRSAFDVYRNCEVV